MEPGAPRRRGRGACWPTTLTLSRRTRRAVLAGLAARQVDAKPFRRVDQASSLRSSVETVQRIFIVIAGIAVLVGVISILNIGLATIGERVDELALRRAVGTTRLQLASIVLTEAVLVGAFAAASALGLGIVLVGPVTRGLFPDLTFDSAIPFPVSAATVGIAASRAAALLGGLIPAARAARIPIAAAMRA